jgi:peptide/nickel transport system permease protein
MLRYIVRRVLIFIPTLIIITLLGFIISVNAPGDPVERMVVAAQSGGEIGSQTVNQIEQKKFWRKKLGLDLPIFYFSLSPIAKPDSLYKIYDKNEREALDRLIDQFGNWNEIQVYFKSVEDLYSKMVRFQVDTSSGKSEEFKQSRESFNEVKYETLALKSTYNDNAIESRLSKIDNILTKYSQFSEFKKQLSGIKTKYQDVKTNSTKWKNYIPKLNFYRENQYHRWMFGDGNWLTGKGAVYTKGIVRGDFGTSYVTKQPISDVIASKIGWSMFFALLSVLLAYLVSIPLGVRAAANRGSKFDRVSSVILFLLYSMPSFWVATLLLMTFANPDMLHIFPASGVKPATGYPEGATFMDQVKLSLPYLILPLICYSYSSFAFLARTMRVSMIETVGQDYVRTAKAKGLSNRKVIWKHAFRNSLLPIITMFANIFPLAIGGSVILETIFTIPGMGYETFVAIQNNNYPMIIAVLTIASFLTLVGFLISDILYALVDPRISYTK